MRLRQARKIEKRMAKTNRAPWWERYPLATLTRATRRLHSSWRTHRTIEVRTEEFFGKTKQRRWLGVTPDYFAGNRLHSFAVRQPLVRGRRPHAPLLKRLGLDRHAVKELARRLRIRHLDSCRAQNREWDGFGYVCSCDFFTIIARAVGRPEAVGAPPLSPVRMRCSGCKTTLERGIMGAEVWRLASGKFWSHHHRRLCLGAVVEEAA